jgi:hypothetical protein
MKLYDFDGMFDEKLSAYIQKNGEKYKEEEWEDLIPQLYAKFGDTYMKSVGNTPNGFYAEMTDEDLIRALKTHLKQGVAVSEFLCKAIESRDCKQLLLPLLKGSENEVDYAMNLLGSENEAIPIYFDMLIAPETNEDRKNQCVDYIKEKADDVKDRAFACYQKGTEREYMLEILSRCVLKDDKIFDALLHEFRGDDENIPMHASYLAAYGDERALPYLLDKIDEENISFIEYQELKYAIEALGGSYEKERDFSSDPYYELIRGHNEKSTDIFSAFEQNGEGKKDGEGNS